jgi:hypothetical protein
LIWKGEKEKMRKNFLDRTDMALRKMFLENIFHGMVAHEDKTGIA